MFFSVHVNLGACASVFLHVQDRCQSQAYPIGTIFPVWVYHCHSVDKASWPVSPVTLSLPPLHCDHKPVQPCSAFMWVLRCQPDSHACSASNYPVTISPAQLYHGIWRLKNVTKDSNWENEFFLNHTLLSELQNGGGC